MKVGTDSVLLGAWVALEGAGRVLDVGTGTGLLSLMVAQRSKSSQITAVEIDPDAATQAKENVSNSPYSDQIQVITGDIKDPAILSSESPFDLIICNPPYFSSGKGSPSRSRTTARHSGSLDLEQLILRATALLRQSGRLALVVPSDSTSNVIGFAEESGLYLQRLMAIHPTPQKPAKRKCLEFGFQKQDIESEILVIEAHGRHAYSEAYRSLTAPFYLDH